MVRNGFWMRTSLILSFNRDFLKYRILQRILMWKKYLYLVCCLLLLACLSCYSEESIQSQSSGDLWTALEQNLEKNEQDVLFLNEQCQQLSIDLENVQQQYQASLAETEQLKKSLQSSKEDTQKWKTCCLAALITMVLESITVTIVELNR